MMIPNCPLIRFAWLVMRVSAAVAVISVMGCGGTGSPPIPAALVGRYVGTQTIGQSGSRSNITIDVMPSGATNVAFGPSDAPVVLAGRITPDGVLSVNQTGNGGAYEYSGGFNTATVSGSGAWSVCPGGIGSEAPCASGTWAARKP